MPEFLLESHTISSHLGQLGFRSYEHVACSPYVPNQVEHFRLPTQVVLTNAIFIGVDVHMNAIRPQNTDATLRIVQHLGNDLENMNVNIGHDVLCRL